MKKGMILLILLTAAIVSTNAVTAQTVEDKINSIITYAEGYEMGRLSYIQLRVHSAVIREEIRALAGAEEYIEVDGHTEPAGLTQEMVEQIFGKPTEMTKWVWLVNEQHEITIDEEMPRWEKIVFDGKKIQITFNAWPQVLRKPDGTLQKYYWVDFDVKFKKKFDFDIGAMTSEIKAMGENFMQTGAGVEELARKMVEYRSMLQGYLEQNKGDCIHTIGQFFNAEDKQKEQKILRWRAPIARTKSSELMLELHMCEECEWPWVDFNYWIEQRGPGEGQMDIAVSEDESRREQYEDKSLEELESMLEQQFAQQIYRGDLRRFAEEMTELKAINRALDEKYYWDESTRQQNYERRKAHLRGMISWIPGFEEELRNEVRFEQRLVEHMVEQKDIHCREIRKTECALDEGCVNAQCVFALGGNEDCGNGMDDDGDTLVDCKDPDCAKQCGRLCKNICEPECWPCNEKQCGHLCKECWECHGEGCEEICQECWPCTEENCRSQPFCAECRACEEAPEEPAGTCENECRSCKVCTSERSAEMCEEACAPCIQCKKPPVNEKCMSKCEQITMLYPEQLAECQEMCRQEVLFYCHDSIQYSPCEGTYLCEDGPKVIPCQIFTCEGGVKQTVPCGQQVYCGQNQVLVEENKCKCIEGYFDCDQDGNCESNMPCVVGGEICDNGIDDDGDSLMDCADLKDCIPFTQCREDKVCFNGRCLSKSEINPCPDLRTEYLNGQCLPICPEGYKRNEDRTCLPMITECPEGYEFRQGICVSICPEGFTADPNVLGRCIPATIQCPTGQEAKDGQCIAIQCPENYQLKEGVCIPILVACPQKQRLENGMCVEERCAEGEKFENGMCVPTETGDEGELINTGEECTLATDCSGENDICSNGICKELPREAVERIDVPTESVTEISIEVHGPIEEPAAATEKAPEETAVATAEEPAAEEAPDVAEEPADTGEGMIEGAYLLINKLTGLFTLDLTGDYFKRGDKCTSDEDCNPNQQCSPTGECHCRNWEGWHDCNGNGDGNDEDGCESTDPTCGGTRELCREGCKPNQYCKEETGNCECNPGFQDCDGDWENGCESEGRCEECVSDDQCAPKRCAEWEQNVVIEFGCYEQGGWMEEKGAIAFSAGCNFIPTGKTESYMGFDAWGETFESINNLARQLEVQNRWWCTFDLESLERERKELEASMNQAFLTWFFEDYVNKDTVNWEKHMGGIFDTYWKFVDNSRQTAERLKCTGATQFPASYTPIEELEYESELGHVIFWEEKKYVKEFDMEVISPYMKIWIFPPKEFVKQQMIDAAAEGRMPGPPEEQRATPGPTPQELTEMRQDPKTMKTITDLADKYGGSADGLVTIVDQGEPVFNMLMTINPDVLVDVRPGAESVGEPDVTVTIDFDFVYDMISMMEKTMQTERPPWDQRFRMGEGLGNVMNGAKMFGKVMAAIASGTIKVEPMSALPDVMKVMKMAGGGPGGQGQGGEGPPEELEDILEKLPEDKKTLFEELPDEKKGFFGGPPKGEEGFFGGPPEGKGTSEGGGMGQQPPKT